MIRTAVLSACGRFRYRLGRQWGEGGVLLFVMLNPSTADADVDDATIRRCVKFAQAHGFGALEVVNLYAFRATDPKDLRRAGYLAGPENDAHIAAAASECAAICVAWGANAAELERPQIVQMAVKAGLDEEMWFGPHTPSSAKDCLPELRKFAELVCAAGVDLPDGGQQK